MRFKFKNGNRQCSIEGQAFVADAYGIITIPAALDARASLDWAGDIVPAHHVGTDKPIAIDDMTHDMLVEALVEATKRRLANASLEELRALAASAAGYHTHNWGGVHLNSELNPAAVAKAMDRAVRNGRSERDEDEFDAMNRADLFAWLAEHDVKALPAMTNDALRAAARQAGDTLKPPDSEPPSE